MTAMDVVRALGLLAGAWAVPSACAGPPSAATAVPAATSPALTEIDAEWSRTWTIEPGRIAEVNLALAAGATMAATFSTDGAPLSWNVHSHEGDDAIIHAEGKDASGELRHVVTKGGMVSFLWINDGPAPVRLTVELTRGGGRVHSTHPAD